MDNEVVQTVPYHTHNGIDSAKIAGENLTLDVSTLNDVNTSRHGFVPEAPNDTTKFLRGDGTWATATATSLQTTITMGENCSAGDILCQKPEDGKYYRCNGTVFGTEIFTGPLAVASAAGTTNTSLLVYLPGSLVSLFSFGAALSTISETAKEVQTTTHANQVGKVYTGHANYQTFCVSSLYSNITAVDVYFGAMSGTGGDITVGIYAVDDTHPFGTGSALGSKTIVQSGLTGNAVNKFSFASAIIVRPYMTYCIKISGTGADSSNYWPIQGNTTSTDYYANGMYSTTGTTSQDVNGTSAVDMYFNVYTTSTSNWTPGDYVYLSNSAGGVTLTPPSSNIKAVGLVISSTAMLFDPAVDGRETLIAKTEMVFDSASTAGSPTTSFTIPLNARKAVIYYSATGTGEGIITMYRDGRSNVNIYAGLQSTTATIANATISGRVLQLVDTHVNTSWASTWQVYFFG